MEDARIHGSSDIYSADEIWRLGEANKIDWRCVGCSSQMTPKAWKPGVTYKRAAHFAALKEHRSDCKVPGMANFFSKNDPKTVLSKDNIQDSYPSVVRFVDRRDVIAQETELACGKKHIPFISQTYNRASNGTGGRWTVTTIRQICKFYQSYHNWRILPLKVPGCKGDTYFTVFKPLSNEHPHFIEENILFTSLFFSIPLGYQADHLRVALNVKSSNSEGQKAQVFLHIDWSKWHPNYRTFFQNYFKESYNWLKKEWPAAKRTRKPAPFVTIYFIGHRLGKKDFMVDDHRKICLIQSF